MSNDLQAKRTKAFAIYAGWVTASGAGAGVLTWLFKGDRDWVERALMVLGGPVVLCLLIYRVYYKDEMTTDRIADILRDAGIVTGVGTTGLAVGPAAEGLIDEFLENAPLEVKSALTAASSTLVIGGACWALIDQAYRDEIGPGEQFARFVQALEF